MGPGLDVVIARVAGALEGPFDVGGLHLDVRASIGAAMGDGTGEPSALLDAADAAIYATKHAGRPSTGAARPEAATRA